MKFARCIVELEKIYGIRQGSAFAKPDVNNPPQLNQTELAKEIGISIDQLKGYKKLLTLIPELQSSITR